MLSYDRLNNNPRVLRALTSLHPEECDTLLMPFEQAWQAEVSTHSRHKASRKRRDGGGRKPRLGTIEDTWLFMLFSCKVSPLQQVIAHVFGMSQGRANEWMHTRSPRLESALGAAHCFPERNPQHLAQVLALCVSVDFTIDGTERPVHRPTAPVEQQDQYSGKKKDPRGKTLASPTSNNVWYAPCVRPLRVASMTNGYVSSKRRCFRPRVPCAKPLGFKGILRLVGPCISPRKSPKATS